MSGGSMAISYMNTEEVNNIGKEIINYANELNSEINSLYERLANVPTVTREWVGDKSVFYFNTICQDKNDMVKFVNNVNNLGLLIEANANKMQSKIQETMNKESD